MEFLAATALAETQAPTTGSTLSMFLPMILVFVVFWFILIMPQRKQQKQRQSMLDALKKGDKVITIGGIHGEILEIDGEDLRLRIGDKLEIKVLRSAVSRVKGE